MAAREHDPRDHNHALERRNDILALIAVGSALAFAWFLGRGNAQACCQQLAVLQNQQFGQP